MIQETTESACRERLERMQRPPQIDVGCCERWLTAAERVTKARDREAMHPAQREIEALEAMLPAAFAPLSGGEQLAGRVTWPPVGVSPEPGGIGWYCDVDLLGVMRDQHPQQAERIDGLLDAWQGQDTASRIIASMPEEQREYMPSSAYWTDVGAAFPLTRIAGCQIDVQRLLRRGLPGVRADILGQERDDEEARILDAAWLRVVDIIESLLLGFAGQADRLPGMQRQAVSCRALCERAPASFQEAMQLAWLVQVCCGVINYGRMDDYLGPFLLADLEEGVISDEMAQDLVCEQWRLIADRHTIFNGRVIIGGRGRQHPRAADRFAHFAIKATELVQEIEPQLTLRLDSDQDPRLFDRSLDAIGAGRTFPMLLNDTVNVPAVAAAFGIDEKSAEQYIPYGCGEFVIDHASVGTPNVICNLVRVLEEVLFGLDAGSQQHIANVALDHPLPCFADLDAVWEAFCERVRQYAGAMAAFQHHSYVQTQRHCRLLPLSLFMDDCLTRGRSLLGGGVLHLGGTMESYGDSNAADAFAAMQQVVFKQGHCDLDDLRRSMQRNYSGEPGILARLLRAPKYGNDDAVADHWRSRVHDLICNVCRSRAADNGLDSFLVVVINNWANVEMGRQTGASADGRLATEPLANGNGPAAGRDIEGPWACLRSQAKIDSAIHAGTVQNLKLGRSWFTGDRVQLRALLQGYFALGGPQLMVTVSDPAELQEAMKRPDDYGHLMVRVGGFSARFIELPRDCQQEICSRSLH